MEAKFLRDEREALWMPDKDTVIRLQGAPLAKCRAVTQNILYIEYGKLCNWKQIATRITFPENLP